MKESMVLLLGSRPSAVATLLSSKHVAMARGAGRVRGFVFPRPARLSDPVGAYAQARHERPDLGHHSWVIIAAGLAFAVYTWETSDECRPVQGRRRLGCLPFTPRRRRPPEGARCAARSKG